MLLKISDGNLLLLLLLLLLPGRLRNGLVDYY